MLRWKSRLGHAWHRRVMRHTHWVVTNPAGGEAFVAYGCPRAVTHFSRQFFGDAPGVRIRRCWHADRSGRHLLAMVARHGFVAAAEATLPAALAGRALTWPRYLGLKAELPADLAECERRLPGAARADLRRIRREGFQLVVAPARPRYREFHEHYFLPSMRARHGSDAYLLSLPAELAKLRERDVFLEVHDGGACLARLVVTESDGTLHMGCLGWLEGREDVYRRHVLGALYWFTLVHALERGLRQVDLGVVPPYLDDGLFAFKAKWHGRLDWELSRHGSWRVLFDPANPLCRRFFDRSSVLLRNPATRRFDVVGNRPPAAVPAAAGQAGSLGEWLAPAAALARTAG